MGNWFILVEFYTCSILGKQIPSRLKAHHRITVRVERHSLSALPEYPLYLSFVNGLMTHFSPTRCVGRSNSQLVPDVSLVRIDLLHSVLTVGCLSVYSAPADCAEHCNARLFYTRYNKDNVLLLLLLLKKMMAATQTENIKHEYSTPTSLLCTIDSSVNLPLGGAKGL